MICVKVQKIVLDEFAVKPLGFGPLENCPEAWPIRFMSEEHLGNVETETEADPVIASLYSFHMSSPGRSETEASHPCRFRLLAPIVKE